MANFFNDISQDVVTATLFATSTGVSTSANLAGSSVNLGPVVANVVNAVLAVGNVAGTSPTADVKMQESTDGSTWSDITDGAFTQVTTSNQVLPLPIKPSKQYVRCTGTVGGTSPVFETTVLVVASRRNTPTNIGGFNQSAAAG